MQLQPKLTRDQMRLIVGDDIRKFRDEKCYTQAYMANKLGIGQSAYQKIEANETKISLERLMQIASILNKPIDAFLNKENELDDDQDFTFVKISKREFELMEKTLIQQEKRINELEEKVSRKNDKIEELIKDKKLNHNSIRAYHFLTH